VAELFDRGAYITDNAVLMKDRLNKQYSSFLQSRPTMCTYYHVNPVFSTTDTGTRDVEGLIDDNSPIRYNKIENFPIYGIDNIQADLSDSDAGLDTSYDGNAVILPNTIYPVPDDYFTIHYLGKEYLFRVNHCTYDRLKSNNYYSISFHLEYADKAGFERMEKLCIEHYQCIFDNIGTKDKCIVRTSDYNVLERVNAILNSLKEKYAERYIDKKYNAAMYFANSYCYMYDSMLNKFINSSKIYEPVIGSLKFYLLYEEFRPYTGMDYEDSIYDRVMKKDFSDPSDINRFYWPEPAINTESVFDYNRDDRVKYLSYYNVEIGPFGNKLLPYFSSDFLNAIKLKNINLLDDLFEKLVYTYVTQPSANCLKFLDDLEKVKIRYNFHTYIWTPLAMYSLRQVLKDIKVDLTALDETLVHQNNY
jgi:hypothetical protein